jgi:integrase
MSVRKRTWVTKSTGEVKTSWNVDYRDQHGKRHIETFAKKKDAEAREAKIRIEVGLGTHVAPSDSISLKDAASHWINRCKADGLEMSTIRGYQDMIDLHILPRIGENTKLAKLTPKMVEAYRDGLLKGNEQHKALSRAMARKVLISLKMLLRASKHAHVADDVRIKLAREEKRPIEAGRDFPQPDEIKRMIACATTPRQKALLLTMVLTGLRASELRGLRWTDVDFDAAELHVRQRADRYRQIGVPKSKAGTRTIPLPPDLISALKVWKIGCPKGPDGLVFPSRKGVIDHNPQLLRTLAPVMELAGVVKVTVDATTGQTKIEPKYGLHSFRHFFASWCINPKNRGGRELPPKEVQHLLGHSSIVMTLDVYGHLFPAKGDHHELAEATRALLLT